MRIAILCVLTGCLDQAPTTQDARHVDVPRGATAVVDLPATTAQCDSDVVSVAIDRGVRITGVLEGDAVVTAGDALVAVHVQPPAIAALAIAPVSLAVGGTAPLHATATDTMGATSDATATAQWVIGDPTIAALDGDALVGLFAGDTELRAQLADQIVALPISVR